MLKKKKYYLCMICFLKPAVMKKVILTLAVLLAYMTMAQGQTYTTLWKQVKEAEQQDLPRTQYDILMKIAAKAQKEHQPGQLMKAELQGARVMTVISPDSLLPAVERMEQRMEVEKDIALKTVYQVVLRRIYMDNSELEKTPQEIVLTSELCRQLAAAKAVDFEPLTVKGVDSRYFDDDLLSVIGYELAQYQPLHDYYEQTGNRHAAFLTGLMVLRQQHPQGRVDLKKSDYLQRVDSLINVYQDLPECGEAAIWRYQYMDTYTTATVEEKWQYINLALDRWGSWKAMNQLRNSQRSLTQPEFSGTMERKVNIPGREMDFEAIRLRNIRQLTMRVYSVKAQGDTELNPTIPEGFRKIKSLLTLLPFEVTHQYVGKKEYEEFKDTMTLAGLPEGVYMIEMESQPATEVSRVLYYVSNVRVMMQGLPENKIRYVVVNATTGQPLKGAHVRLMEYNNKVIKTLTTDEQGEVIWQYEDIMPNKVFAYTDEDKFCVPLTGYSRFTHYEGQRHVERMQIFTDRALYRPGQTVHAAVIAYATDNGYEHKVMEGKSLTLTLRDANHKVVSEKKLVTDQYGTSAADFTLPVGLLNGAFTLETANGSCSFRVEEYKRPTFEVKFPEVNQHYEDGDTVQVRATARSFAGVPVQSAKVHYTVVRRRAWWWLSYNSYWNQGYIGTSSDEEEVASGDTMTGADGTFVVDMPMTLPPSLYPQFYNFVCTAEVTDQAGETHQAQLSLPLGNRKTAFSCDLDEKVLMEQSPKMTFRLRNAAGIDINASLRYKIDNGKWQTANTQQKIAVPALKSGSHMLEAICEEDTLKRDFVVFSLNDKRPAVETDEWCYQSATRFPNDGTPVTIQVGSSDKDVHIVYTMIAGKKVLESGAVNKTNELINRKLTYKEEYGDGVLLNFAWVKDGMVHSHAMSIERPLPDKHLTLAWETFRDRLKPGQQEEWRLTVKAPSPSGKAGDGVPADAQLVATLYDKSLDQLQKHQWSLSPYVNLSLPYTRWRCGGSWGSLHLAGEKSYSWLPVSNLSLTAFDRSIFPQMVRVYYTMESRRLRGKSGALLQEREVVLDESIMDNVKAYSAESAPGRITGMDVVSVESKRVVGNGLPMAPNSTSDMEKGASEEQEAERVQVRENLQETAFFYPQLVADSTGGVSLLFTLPESLTTWRFMGLAHTKDLCYGMLDGETVAQKDVMIQPNVPRFVREGDQATVSARIFNLSGKTIAGSARMQLLDPATETVVYETVMPFSLTADSTASVTFWLQPQTEQLLICRVTASGKGFSDGEQHYLPVLPATERVTVTVPFTQNEPGTKTVDLTKLFPQNQSSNSKPKLTLEYTNNPAWLMIQALPAVGHPHDDCVVCQATALYANSIGKFIIDQVPQAKNVFVQWQQEKGRETSLNSQLEKNQELKDLLLEESPWVMDADREDEQRQRLADFFDVNLMSQRLSSATDKLKALQRGDGSWSWWPDMPGSTYMTMAISEMLVRLNTMTGAKQPMLDGAFKFLGSEIVELVKEMKKQEKKGYRQTFPSHTALQWLYICKLDGRQLSASVQQANDYLIGLLKKETKNQGIYEKAMSSIILDSPLYIKSLKEYTVYKEEMGRYYDTPRAGYSWRDYRIPTQVAAIEAIQRLTPDDKQTLTEMRRWLLQEKRTQAWDTPLNSVDAVYAFLSEGGVVNREQLVADVPTELKLDGKAVEMPKSTAGIGYVKTAQPYQGEKTFTAEKTGKGVSWGAVYAQFMQATSDIKDNGSGVTIKREILNAEANASLKVGDRVTVRLTIQSERDLDFVQVQDKRAACLEPVKQLSGYNWQGGYYCSPRDNTTNFFFDRLSKGKHVIETEYYIDRPGQYETGTCTVQCAYAPEYRGTTHSQTIRVNDEK